MNLKSGTKNKTSKTIESNLGISYEEFEQLDLEEQQRLIEKYKKIKKEKTPDEITVMIDSGDNAIFAKVKKGKKVMVGSGEHSCFVRAGVSPEEERQEVDNKIDDMLYSGPAAFVKKLQRKIRNTNK